MQNYRRFIFIWGLVFWSALSFASPFPLEINEPDSLKTPKNWFNLDPEKDGVMGTSANRAHEKLLEGKNPQRTVIVAVIDSGVDIEHEDLQGKIWVNQDEIQGNGKDDDGNGYIDDVNGWNFIGGADGANIEEDSYELTREYVRLKPIYEDADPDRIKRRHQEEYDYWLRIKKELEEKKEEAELNYKFTSGLQENLIAVAEVLKEALGKEDMKEEDLAGLESGNEEVEKAAAMVGQMFMRIGQEGTSLNEILEDLAGVVEHYENQVKFAYNPHFDPREIVGDDPIDYKDKTYGNPDVIGPDASHGTHVAGIIAADRTNDLGIQGIAEHVLIMPVRAVPNGDERDKDIANAIYYAVDNGAHIINMSFGKSYSPGKNKVDKAVKYAKRKGVLLVHAAGNSGKEVHADNNFPNRWLTKRRKAPNWIEVGANAWQGDKNLPGSFSNYSDQGVDLFAPGVDMYSTLPGNEYKSNSGTSMAAPVVSGVTALIMAYYPDLKPSEVKAILKQSVYNQAEQLVIKPGNEEEVAFGSLSITGGVVNAYQALQLAESIK
ncbi:MAG: S8 family peptidase [Anditalea sp.]